MVLKLFCQNFIIIIDDDSIVRSKNKKTFYTNRNSYAYTHIRVYSYAYRIFQQGFLVSEGLKTLKKKKRNYLRNQRIFFDEVIINRQVSFSKKYITRLRSMNILCSSFNSVQVKVNVTFSLKYNYIRIYNKKQ